MQCDRSADSSRDLIVSQALGLEKGNSGINDAKRS